MCVCVCVCALCVEGRGGSDTACPYVHGHYTVFVSLRHRSPSPSFQAKLFQQLLDIEHSLKLHHIADAHTTQSANMSGNVPRGPKSPSGPITSSFERQLMAEVASHEKHQAKVRKGLAQCMTLQGCSKWWLQTLFDPVLTIEL